MTAGGNASPTHGSVRLLLIDDNELLCAAMSVWLARQPALSCVATVTDWTRARDEVARQAPDVVLLDVDFPGVSGFDLLLGLLRDDPRRRVVMFSGLAAPDLVDRALELGAAGYIVKDEQVATIARLVQRAARGEVVLSPIAAALVLGHDAAAARPEGVGIVPPAMPPPTAPLKAEV